jgi:hypothetical protein
MGLFDIFVGGRAINGAPYKSKSRLNHAVEDYLYSRGAVAEFPNEELAVVHYRGKTSSIDLGMLALICKNLNPESWNNIIREHFAALIPTERALADTRNDYSQQLAKHQERLTELSAHLDLLRQHLRLEIVPLKTIRRADEIDLLQPIYSPLVGDFFTAVTYDFTHLMPGLLPEHAAMLGDTAAIFEQAWQNVRVLERSHTRYESGVEQIAGSYAGVMLTNLGVVFGDKSLLVGAPSPNQMLWYELLPGQISLTAIQALQANIYRLGDFSAQDAGFTYKSIFWWHQGRLTEVPSFEKTILLEGSQPYHLELPAELEALLGS